MARNLLLLLIFALSVPAQKPARRVPAPKPPPQAAAQDFPLHSITVEGNKILQPDAILSASGLKPGAKADKAAFDAAQARLLATGYFETVGYRYKPAADGRSYDATFEVQEIQTLYPLRFESLAGSRMDILAWIKARDPLFPGKLPGTQPVVDRTARFVEQYEASLNKPEKITGKMVGTAPDVFELQFQPARGLASVADVTFEGNKALDTGELHRKIADVAFGQPYTETNFRQLLDNQIRPLYESRGYLRVAFPRVTTAPAERVKGVDVHVAVDEGSEYKLARVVVAGRMASEGASLLKKVKFPQVTIADFDQIGQAVTRVKDEMKHRGFLHAEVTTQRKLDEAKKTVDVFLVVEPGTQYMFGQLTVLGLGLDGEAAIKKMWSIKPGDAFPVDYPNYFLTQVKAEGLFDNLGDTLAKPEINDDTHVVNVSLDFKTAPPPPKKPKLPGAVESSAPPF